MIRVNCMRACFSDLLLPCPCAPLSLRTRNSKRFCIIFFPCRIQQFIAVRFSINFFFPLRTVSLAAGRASFALSCRNSWWLHLPEKKILLQDHLFKWTMAQISLINAALRVFTTYRDQQNAAKQTARWLGEDGILLDLAPTFCRDDFPSRFRLPSYSFTIWMFKIRFCAGA